MKTGMRKVYAITELGIHVIIPIRPDKRTNLVLLGFC